MDDSLKILDLSAEGTVSIPPAPPVVETPQPTIVAQSSGPTDKKPMGKKTKIVAGILSILVLLSGLGIGIFLSRQKQLSAIKAGGPNICTWETCGDDPNKWAAGAAAAEGKAQENPNVAAIVNQIVETAANNSNNNSSVGNQIQHIEAVLNTNLNDSEKQALNGVLNTSQQQALSGALTPTTIPTKPSSNTSSDNLKVGKDGGWVVKDTVPNQKIDNSCNVTLDCDTRAKWEAGWLAARQDPKYLATGIVPKQPEYTDIARDLDNNPSNGIQVGTITNNAGVLEIKDVFTVTSSNTGGCALNDYGCIETYLRSNPNANNSISLSGKVGYIDKNGKIVFNSPASDAVGGGIPVNLILTASQCSNSNSCCGWLNPNTGNTVWFDGSKDIATKTCYQQAYDYTKKLFTWGSRIGGVYCSGIDCENYYNVFGWNGKGFDINSCSSSCNANTKVGQCCSYGNGTICVNTSTSGMLCGTPNINGYYCQVGSGFTAQDLQNKMPANGQTAANAGCNTGATGSSAFDATRSCGIQQLDIDLVGSDGKSIFHASRNLLDLGGCSTPPITTIPSTYNPPKPPTTTTTTNGGGNPTPTPITNTPSYACYQLQIFRGTTQIQPWQINVGDALIFRGFATATNTTVSKIRFVISINGAAQAPVDVNATLISGQYQADLPYTITQAASYSVTASPISP